MRLPQFPPLTRSQAFSLVILSAALFMLVLACWKRSRRSFTPAIFSTSRPKPLASTPATSPATAPALELDESGGGEIPPFDGYMLASDLGSFEPPSPERMAHELLTLNMRVGALEACQTGQRSKK